MAKKRGVEKDAAADFFGDSDVDWLDDEEDDGSATRERLPVAPPPPPPFKGQSRTATPLEAAPRATDKKPLSSAPTLIFSSVPTLPPGPTPTEDEPAAPEPLDARPPVADIPTSEQPTVEIELPKVAPKPAPEAQDAIPTVLAPNEVADEEDEDQEVYGDDLDSQVPRQTPLVKTADPTPARVSIDPAPARAAAPRKARSQRPASTWEPAQGIEAWRKVQQTLIVEAASARPEASGVLLERAGRVAELRLGDLDGAVAIYADARRAGRASLELLRARAEALGRLGRFEEQAKALAELGEQSEGTARAAALLEAGLVAWRRLNRPAEAVEHLRGAAAADPDDYTSRALLRALLPSIGAPDPTERVTLLGELAALAEGGIAADAHVEAAAAAEEAGDTAGTRRHLERALKAEPGHAGAFLRLERLLADDPAARAARYEVEAKRKGQTDPGWWRAEAARAWQAAGRGDAAVEAFEAAIKAGHASALRELQGGWMRAGAWSELAQALEREASALTPEQGSAFAWFRLGWLRESRLDDREGAVDAYRKAVEADASATPAGDAVIRLLRDNQEARRAFWDDRLASASDLAERHALSLRLGESSEAPITGTSRVKASDQQEAARERFEGILSGGGTGAVAHVARDGLERVLQRLGDTTALAAARRDRAATATDPAERASWLFLAATAAATPAEPVLDDLRAALDAKPDHGGALSALALALEATEGWSELGERLRAAGDAATDPERRAAYLYRAGRVFAELARDDVSARACVEHALHADPSFRPARWLLRSLGGTPDAASVAALYREEAAQAADATWPRFAAAVAMGSGPEARDDLQAILDSQPDHPGALAALEVQLVAEGDTGALVDLYLRAIEAEPTPELGKLTARVAAMLADHGDAQRALGVLDRLAGMDVEGRPLRAASRLALRLGARDLALKLLDGLDAPEDRVEKARLLGQAGRPAEALPLLTGLLDDGADPVGIGARTATVAQQVGDADAMLRAYVTIARRARGKPLAAAYGAWTGMQLQGSDNVEEALEFWRIARGARPGSPVAVAGVVRGLVAQRDADGIVDVLSDAPPEALADALADAGAFERAAAVLADALPSMKDEPARDLAALVVLERLYEEADAWQETYDVLARRRELCVDPTVQAEADTKRRWILSEKLAETDAAWELYRKLHDDAPDDQEVTEALARIAGARGEVALAIGYLQELVDGAASPEEAARYQRRIGEVYERAGQGASARQAYLDALDHVRTDTEALDGLKRLAEQDEDWPTLISVLEREANLVDGERQAELRRQIARVTEERLEDQAVAMDKWRALLDVAPSDREALDHLQQLSRQLGEWGLYVETGEVLAGLLEGRERAELLREIGVACEEKLGRGDAVTWYERAVAIEPPDAEAARRLEKLARLRADWPAAVRALSLQARGAEDDDSRVAALLAAARIEVEARHDREAASSFYDQVLALRPEHEQALRFMASHLFETGRFDEALPICERLEPMVEEGQDLDDFDTRMELSSFHFYFAEMLRLQGREEESISRYERALELNPTHLPSLEAVGPLYTETGAWKKAERVYRQLLQLSGGQGDRQKVASLYTALGLVERRLDNPEKAYKRFNKALELHPNHVGALKGMALILEDREDWSNLLNVYNNIIYHATVPEDVIDAYMTKGRILDEQMQRQDKAAQHFQRSLDFDANQPAAYLRLAELAMRRDGYEDAGKLAEKALQLDEDLVQPHRALLLLVRAASWQDARRTSEAERCVREARLRDKALVEALGDAPLQDLEQLRQAIRDRLP